MDVGDLRDENAHGTWKIFYLLYNKIMRMRTRNGKTVR